MAEELLDDAIGRSTKLAGRVKCRSAGTFACEGAEATSEAIQVMDEYGLNLEKHRARQFNCEMADKYDVLLAMDYNVFEALTPDYVHKMHTMLGYALGLDGDRTEERLTVLDPFDEGLEEYRECAQQLADATIKIVKRLEDGME
jgi:protein-tyrosine phosphatase